MNLTLSMPKQCVERLKTESERSGISMSEIIRHALAMGVFKDELNRDNIFFNPYVEIRYKNNRRIVLENAIKFLLVNGNVADFESNGAPTKRAIFVLTGFKNITDSEVEQILHSIKGDL